MNFIRLILPVALAFSVGVSGLALQSAQANEGDKAPGLHNKGMHHGKGDWKARKAEHHARMVKELGLTPEQQDRIQAIKKNYFETHKDEIEAMKAKHQDFRKLKESGASPEVLEARRKEMKAEFADRKGQHKELMNEIKSVLTPEQVAKMDALKAQRKKDGHHKQGGPRPPADATQ